MLASLLFLGTSVIWVPALIIYFIYRSMRSKPAAVRQAPNTTAAIEIERDKQWTTYIAAFRETVSTKKETQLIDAILSGMDSAAYGKQKIAVASVWSDNEVYSATPESVAEKEPDVPKEPIDSTLLLLYFGAFLLVASVGLFVAISGLDGLLRTFIVAATAAILFYGGLQIYENNEKLAAAGTSFVGSGMIIAPLTGVAWFNLVSHKSGAGIVWLATSVICIALYAYAFQRIRNDFMAYLLIGSLVSAVESSVLTIGLPSYGYAWGLVVAGIFLNVSNQVRNQEGRLARSGSTSAALIVPLSMIGSIALFPQYGSVQLAVTLLLSSVYYWLLSNSNSFEKVNYRIASQVSALAGIANFVYAYYHNLEAVGLMLTLVTAVYTIAIIVSTRQTTKENGLLEISIVSGSLSVVLSLSQPWYLVAAIAIGVLLATSIWKQEENDEALQVAGILLIILPFVIGQYALVLGLNSSLQLAMSALVALLLEAVIVVTIRRDTLHHAYDSAAGLYWSAAAATLVPAIAIGPAAVAGVVGIILLSSLLLHTLSKDSSWLLGSGLAVFVPVAYGAIHGGFDSTSFSVAVLVALFWNSFISLMTRQQVTRALVVISILLTPIALGGGGLNWHWGSYGYSFGYMAAMAGCLTARAIARGKLLVSFKVPIASYYADASQAYIAGYVTAGVISLLFSLDTSSSRWLTTTLLAIISIMVVLIARIERKLDVLVFLPVLLQAAILSVLRPSFSDAEQLGATALLLTIAAAASYGLTFGVTWKEQHAQQQLLQVSMYLAYAGPALALFNADGSLLLPLSLLVAGLVTHHYNRNAVQSTREASLGVCIAAVHWFVFILGVHNLQIHTHILAFFLAGFAYWRYVREDNVGSQNYVQALFFVVTIPLALQSLGGEAGGYYGLILIFEQVLFMAIGAMLPPNNLGQHFLLRWGLWTALAAILFQLRGLGWAFVSLLALIIIGTAVYRLQKKPLDK